MGTEKKSFVLCQTCGEELFELSAEGKEDIIENPYNYVFYCKECKQDNAHIDENFSF